MSHPVITRVDVYPDVQGEYRWTAYAANGETIAVSSEGYAGVQHCEEAARALFPDAHFNVAVEPAGMMFRRRRRVRIHFLPVAGGEIADLEGVLAGRVDGRYLLLAPKMLQSAESTYTLDNAVEIEVGTIWFMERLAPA